MSFFRQFSALNRKNLLLRARAPWAIVLELLLPVAFIVSICIVQALVSASRRLRHECFE